MSHTVSEKLSPGYIIQFLSLHMHIRYEITIYSVILHIDILLYSNLITAELKRTKTRAIDRWATFLAECAKQHSII